MSGTFKQYLQGLISIIYPNYCAACEKVLYHNEQGICLRCLAELPRTKFHSDPENEVARIFWGRIPVVHATSFMFFTRDSRYRQILHEIKYKGQQELARQMGRMFGLELKSSPFAGTDLIIPVPLHPSKYRQRGYNQSELIACGISEVLGKPVINHCVGRFIPTRTQTQKSRYERWENVKGTFRITDENAIRNKHILLIDDVITTGATIEACAETILQAEGTMISIASLACVKLL
ncbi:MAG TPA: ComF family protein [Bacteroidales bacterium]|nr:ComF family protein [Bacteroidales bacterium]